jgi:Lipocalin-like domain
MRLFRIAAAVASLVLAAPSAFAQSNSLTGSWTLVSSVVEQGGNRIEPFGPNPKGALIFDANGRYAAMIMRPGLPKLASDNRTTATPEEAKAIVAGSIAHFGSYVVSDVDKTITFRIETSTHPNWDGTEQKRSFTTSGDELKYIGVSAVVGGASATLTWKRAK